MKPTNSLFTSHVTSPKRTNSSSTHKMGDASHYEGMLPHYKETRVAADDKLPLRVADHQSNSAHAAHGRS